MIARMDPPQTRVRRVRPAWMYSPLPLAALRQPLSVAVGTAAHIP
jgi:hypothetical protein